MQHPPGPPAAAVPARREVTLRTLCWACGGVLTKLVLARRLAHRHFSWRCDGCEVAWVGPGDAV
jgi:hypothetical protein